MVDEKNKEYAKLTTADGKVFEIPVLTGKYDDISSNILHILL